MVIFLQCFERPSAVFTHSKYPQGDVSFSPLGVVEYISLRDWSGLCKTDFGSIEGVCSHRSFERLTRDLAYSRVDDNDLRGELTPRAEASPGIFRLKWHAWEFTDAMTSGTCNYPARALGDVALSGERFDRNLNCRT